MLDTLITLRGFFDPSPPEALQLLEQMEAGLVLFFPDLPFVVHPEEKRWLRPDVGDPKTRNISLRPDGTLSGASPELIAEHKTLASMIARFSRQATDLIHSLAPSYRQALRIAPASYRPNDVATRVQSRRADDRRLHIDAFPSRPNRGERILRVFTNINPQGQPRVWRIGEPFEDVARHWVPRTKPYSAWQAGWLHRLQITKTLRSEYDHLMLQLHDGMKGDEHYQLHAPQFQMSFPPGSTWVCFSDQTTHAAMSGQYLMEQTFHISPDDQLNRNASPLAILEAQLGRKLA